MDAGVQLTVYKRGGVWWMHFRFRGRRTQKSTGQITREAAEAVERNAKDAQRQAAHGVAITPPLAAPRFQDWAEIYYVEASKRVRRADRLEYLTRVALGFWGERPTAAELIYPDAPYHDLRLHDPIDDPTWLLRWEDWLAAPKRSRPRADGRPTPTRVWSGQTKNQYRSLLSQFYALALKPSWRLHSHVTSNPCTGGDRDHVGRRVVALPLEDLRAIVEQSSDHLRLAIAIALLAPKLRLGDILKLRYDQHFSPGLEWMTVHDHKTSGTTRKPLVAYVPEQLRAILRDAQPRAPKERPYVVHYLGQPITELRGAVRGAVERAAVARPQLRYGRYVAEGISFHTLRHSAATKLAELGISPDARQGVMGHEDMATTLWYTHLRPIHEVAPTEALSAALPLQDLIIRAPPVAPAVSHSSPGDTQSPAFSDALPHQAKGRKQG